MEPARQPSPEALSGRTANAAQAVLQAVSEAISRTRFGAIQITVHDGRVVQIDVTEKQRFT